MDVEIESLVREAVAAAMRDIQQNGVDIAVVDDMVNASGSQTVSGGEGIDSGGSGMCGAFAFEDGKIKPGGFYRARSFDRVYGEATIPKDYTGYVSVKAPLRGSAVLALTDTIPLPNENESYMPLYKFKDGTIEEDYRGSPHVQMWE